MATSLFEADKASDIPLWIQLYNRFVYLINTGYFEAGDQLPSVRSLAAEIAVNYNTVSKAYSALNRDGYTTHSHGRGVFVNEIDGPLWKEDELTYTEAIAEDFVKSCLAAGMSFDEIGGQVERTILKMRNGQGEQGAR